MLYTQLWHDPVKEGILKELSPVELQTLVAISIFMNRDGKCYPTQQTLAKKLGITEDTAQKRISKLKVAEYKGKPVVTAKQEKSKKENGQYKWGPNHYQLSKEIMEFISFGKTGSKKERTEKPQESDGIPLALDKNKEITARHYTGGGKEADKLEPIINNKEQQAVVEQLKSHGVRGSILYELVEDYSAQRISDVIEHVKSKEARLENPAGFIVKALREEFNTQTKKKEEENEFEKQRIEARIINHFEHLGCNESDRERIKKKEPERYKRIEEGARKGP